jgi:hypothetical protein
MENETPVNTGKTEIPAWLYTFFAWMMIGHFIYIFGRCVLRGTPADMFYISHVELSSADWALFLGAAL